MAVLTREELKAEIDAIIKANKMKQITGPKLNQVLTDMLDTLNAMGDNYFIIRSTGPQAQLWKFGCDDTGSLSVIGELVPE